MFRSRRKGKITDLPLLSIAAFDAALRVAPTTTTSFPSTRAPALARFSSASTTKDP